MLTLYGFRATRPWSLSSREVLVADEDGVKCFRDLETGKSMGANEHWSWEDYTQYRWQGPTPRWALDDDLRMDEGL